MLSPAQQKEHVLNRVALGISPRESQRYDSLGRQGYIAQQLDWAHDLSSSQVGSWRAATPPNGQAPNLNHAAAVPLRNWEYYQRWHITRAVDSDRQLLEVLVDFWWNHFNVSASSPNEVACWEGWSSFYAGLAERALGSFEDLMRFATMSHSMQDYLDNVYNTVDEPNENLGREILELHTMGVHAGYTQADVVAASRILTGWTGGVNANSQGVPFGAKALAFSNARHDSRAKTLLGREFPANVDGRVEQDEFLGFIANHPKTREYIAWRLCELFVSDSPSAGLVAAATAAFNAADGDLHSLVQFIFGSDEFNSAASFRAKAKKPRNFAVSLGRAFGRRTATELDDLPSTVFDDGGLYAVKEYVPASPIMRFMNDAGEVLFFNSVPTGYPNVGHEWLSAVSLAARLELASHAAENWRSTLSLDASLDDQAFVDQVEQAMSPGGFSSETRNEIIEQIAMLSGDARTKMALWLAATSPEFASY